MGTLEEIQQMQQSGMNEAEIISKLQEQGVPYRDISEALAQNRIKSAVEGNFNGSAPPEEQPADQFTENNNFASNNPPIQAPQGMQPSLLQGTPQAEAGSQQQEYFPAYETNAQTTGNYDQR